MDQNRMEDSCAEEGRLEERIVRHLFLGLTSPQAREMELPEDMLAVDGMRELYALIWDIRRMALSLANGELDYHCRERGYVVGALKAFQAHLRHLTWQTHRIAGGEFDSRVNFLGEFAGAFNQMTEQLNHKIHDLRSLSEEYKELSLRDPLTGLYNRNAFLKFSKRMIALSQGKGVPSSLIMIDLDKFKNINDQYGHVCGDYVLRSFAQRIQSAMRPDDLLCRYGGEEFLILMPDTPKGVALRIAERLRATIEELEINCEDVIIRISASFGVSEIILPEVDCDFTGYLNTCIAKADNNLYRAKSMGRNRVVAD